MPNYATFVVSSAIYVSVKTLEREGSISSFRYYGQLLFTPFHQENEKAGGGARYPKTNGGKLLRKPSSSFEKLMDRVTFRILSNINDGVSQ